MSEKKYPRILRAMSESPWAILPEKWITIRDLINFRAEGGRLTHEEIRERIGEKEPAEPYCVDIESGAEAPISAVDDESVGSQGVVAILPLFGVMAHHLNEMEESSGGISTERFMNRFKAVANDPNVRAIIINVDSPGGTVSGVSELADEIFAARQNKPITAVANAVSASAAFWVASAAERFTVTPSGMVGSIGVFSAHQDFSEFEKILGVKTTLISAGKFKTEGNPFEPLAEEARAAFQKEVDVFFEMFIKAVALHRGVSVSDVRGGFGEGRMVGSAEAKRLGMVDAVSTLDQEISRLIGVKGDGGNSAQSDPAFSMSDLDQVSADGECVFDPLSGVDGENSERESAPRVNAGEVKEECDGMDHESRRRDMELLEL